MAKVLTISLAVLFLIGCGSYDVNVDDSEQIAYVSLSRTWEEVCEDRFNKYDYPDDSERDMIQAECRRKFATGEEELNLPEIPGGIL